MDSNVQKEDFAGMVRRLFKEMDSLSATNIHAAVGITGEAAELFQAILLGDIPNVMEELGDARFYMQKLFNTFGWTLPSLLAGGLAPDNFTPIQSFVIAAGDVQDQLKKNWVYNKPLDSGALWDAVWKLASAYMRLLFDFNLSDEQVCEANVYKLVTGPNARFPLGYSDAAAQARADKVGTPEEVQA